MTKKELRQKVWERFNEKCAYCGNDLKYKDMQVDHFYPQCLSHYAGQKYPSGFYNSKKEPQYIMMPLNFEALENLMPSCRRCNHYKREQMPEHFRATMMTIHERIMKMSLPAIAMKYGIVKIMPFNGDFYFEKLKI